MPDSAPPPTLRGLDTVDDPRIAPSGYHPEIIWEGLNLLPYSIVVHYKSNHPESQHVEKEVAFYERNKLPYRTLRDGEVLIVNGAVSEAEVIR